ncbi:MAG: ATP-binding protein [Dehalococcoidales bacterium]|nr:ATP-binding protein [Dehalococcoidales bacterium]
MLEDFDGNVPWDSEDNEEEDLFHDTAGRTKGRLEKKNSATINNFLGKGKRFRDICILPRYYGELLAWVLGEYLATENLTVSRILGNNREEPCYIDVNLDCTSRKNCLIDGKLLVNRGDEHFVISVDINLKWLASVTVEGAASSQSTVQEMIKRIEALAKELNFYRGTKIEFTGRIHFLNRKDKNWDSIIVDPSIKQEIKANTTGFLARMEIWNKLGIPPKRGVLLVGEPGTGKTIICKALMSEAENITGINANAYGLAEDDYLTELYELAEDLAPCLVFLEDIDLIGQDRDVFGYPHGAALLSLLAVLDGVEEKAEIVTVATTNCLETLDKAISRRPSRFDRVIKLGKPNLDQRRDIIDRICGKIPLEESAKCYIARHSEGMTPAQLQEIVFSLAIENVNPQACLKEFTADETTIDRLISKIRGKGKISLGFGINGSDNRMEKEYMVNRVDEKH